MIATISEANNDTIKVIPSGFSIRPSKPSRRNRGTNVMIIIMVALRIDDLISDEALNTTGVTGSLSLCVFRTFFPKLLVSILNINDCIINKRSDRNCHASETHCVDRISKKPESDKGYKKREWDCHK